MSFLQLISPVDSAWGGSRLVLDGYVSESALSHHSVPLAASITIAALVVLFILLYRRVTTAIVSSGVVLAKKKGFHLFEDKYTVASIRLAITISFVLIPLILSLFGLGNPIIERSDLDEETSLYLSLLIYMVGFFLFKGLLLRIIGWITNKKGVTHIIEYLGFSSVICFGVMLLIFSLFTYIIPSISESGVFIYLAIIGGLTFLLTLIRGFQIFLASGYSLYFWFLYLCALELMPIGIVVKMALL